MSIFYLLLSFILSTIFAVSATAQIVLSEIMFDPLGSESHEEFVEIVNLSNEDVDVADWQITDGTRTDIILPHQNVTIIAPGQFAVIFDPSYFENSTVYDSLVQPTTLLLTLDNTTFGSSGLSNSTAETISLINSQGDTVSSYTYSLGNAPGFSDEKINLNGENVADNWKNSKTLHGTPGSKNSQSPLNYDLSFSSNGLLISPEILNQNENATVSATIQNVGLNPIQNFNISFYADFNANGAVDFGEELISPITISESLQSGDSTIVDFVYNVLKSGAYNIFSKINFDLDEDTANNISFAPIQVGFPGKSLRINEIMYSPLSEQPEWVELINTSPDTINIQGWAVSDDNLSSLSSINTALTVNPNEFLTLAKDSSIANIFTLPDSTLFIFEQLPSLNNSDDSIVLYDLIGNVIDRVDYSSDWGGNFGISLEKINPLFASSDSLNWNSSVVFEGGTPGETNSIFSEFLPTNATLSITPNPFSPDNDGHDDTVIISYNLPVTTALINIKIYDLRGRLIRFLANSKPTGSDSNTSPAIVWDGKNDNGDIVRIGIYVVFLEAVNAQAGVLEHKKKTVVLAGQL